MVILEYYPLERNDVWDPRLTAFLYLIATFIVKRLFLGRTLSTVQVSLFVLSDFQLHSNVREGFLLPQLILRNWLNIPFSYSCEIHHILCCMECLAVMMSDASLSHRGEAHLLLLLDCSIFYWITFSKPTLTWRLEWQLPSLMLGYQHVFVDRRQYRCWQSATIGPAPVLYWWFFSTMKNYSQERCLKTQASTVHRQLQE